MTRAAALAALLVVAVLAAVLLIGGAGSTYTVKARFQNASQLVKGNLVQVGGAKAGQVTDIALTDDGQAEVTMELSDAYAPLRRGTRITVRQASLSGVANRYLDLRLAPQRNPEIPDGATIAQTDTTTAVDLDQIFNTFDPETRKALTGVIRGSGRQYAGRGRQMQEAIAYLNPSLSASSRLFRELNRDTRLFERFIVSSSQLVTDIADRRDDLAGLVDGLATTTTAIGDEKAALADSIGRLPDFMRRANTTFLNLRAALDDLDPLVEESKPVARELRPFLDELRPLARDARPTLRDLSRLIRREGDGNDLVELTNAQPPLAEIAVDGIQENGADREGALPASTKALKGSTPIFAHFRPYSVDFLGWFDDFSHTGVTDALGAVSRASPHASAFLFANSQLVPVPPELRAAAFENVATLGQTNRCPGAGEHLADDGTNPWKPTPDYNCDPTQVLPGE